VNSTKKLALDAAGSDHRGDGCGNESKKDYRKHD
jgi:hypothetical protein